MTNFEKLIFIPLAIIIIGAPLIAFYTASIECTLYNDKFGTHYTSLQFLFASDTIKSFLKQGKQETKNINITGLQGVQINPSK